MKVKNEKGFTLIELAVVLVLIGIILGAVLKGQDLIDNARAKQFATEVRTWETALYNYLDRKGRLPGDADRDGVVGDSDPQGELSAAKLVNIPSNSFILGATGFNVYLGSGTVNGPNYLVMCKGANCSGKFDPNNAGDLAALKYFESFDTTVDGTASANAASNSVVTAFSAITSSGNTFTAITLGSSNGDWLTPTNIKGLAYQIR
ncbi:MAG: type II secretion system GspH family protein [Alphaproteobacteria bacterium]|uniref:Type II secretion system GspH family protein n=1 Tax=Candidatus Nitrobium versatile TaxID=2884831 RepID=A0A953J448_9BACT|nr:type II secretion system GspH family protein [Candidatus Nitrobium versatile]